MNLYGYARVSTREQNEDRQVISLSQVPVPLQNIFVDKQSGKDFHRPMYRRLVRQLKPGDVLFVKSIDRLGRNYEEIMQQWRIITRDKGADIVILDMPLLDTRVGRDLIGTFISDLVLQLLSFVAENERQTIHRRQAEGIAAAQARGVRFGRPQKIPPEDFLQIVSAWKQKKITTQAAAERCGFSKATYYRHAREVLKNQDSYAEFL